MSAVNMAQPGIWQRLFPSALALMTHLENQVPGTTWTFGGGTVLMLRIAHRHSKDIDLFVPNPQYLGFVNPRLSDVAADVSSDYEEATEFVKLFLPDGEIDIVAGGTLTDRAFDLVDYDGRQLRVETSAEIIAKKMWHRGDRAKGRDLFDLCAVADSQPDQIRLAAPHMVRHGAAFLTAIIDRAKVITRELEEIDVIGPTRSYAQCREQAESIIRPLLR